MLITRQKLSYLWLALALSSCGCLDLFVDSAPAGVAKGQSKRGLWGGEEWDPQYLLAGGGGIIVTFESDMALASGYVTQFGLGYGLGGGLRFMDFNYDEETSGNSYRARTLLLYFGAGVGGGQPNGRGAYGGFGLGGTKLWGPGVTDRYGFSGGVVYGVTAYHDFATRGGIGVAAEAGLLFSAPNEIDLHGLTLILATYLYF